MFGVRGREKGWTGGGKEEKTATTGTIGSREDPVSESVPWITFFFRNYTVNVSN